MKVKNQYLKILEYLHLSFNKLPSIQYKFWVSLVLWNHNNGEDCWLGNDPEDEQWHPPQRVSHKRSLLKGVAVYRVLYQTILNAKLTGRKNLGRKRCTSNRDDRKLENTVKQSWFKHLGELHKEWTEAGVSASRVTTLRRLEDWRGTESMLLEVQCEVSTVSDDLGCHVICWCWSTVFSEVHSQRSHLPGHFRALHASFCWQALWRCWFHFPAGLGTCPHCQRYQKLVQWPWCYCGWLASKLAWPKPHRESMGYCQEEDERHQTQQCRWAEGHCQRNLGFHTT